MMDLSQMIQGTRQFFQGHPGKPRDDVVDSDPQLIETKCSLKNNEPYSYNPTSYSNVMKSNHSVQSSHGTALPQYYPRPYCEQITYQQKVPSSYQVNEACTVDTGAKYESYTKPNASQITYKPTLQYEQNLWKNNISSKVCDPSLKVPLNQVLTFSMATNTNPGFGTSLTYKGQQKQVSLNTNEIIVPATSYMHHSYASEAVNLSQYSEITVRQPFIQSTAIVSHGQSCNSTNVYQTQRSSVPCSDNANSMNFRDQGQQTFGKLFDSAPSLLRQTDHSSATVSRDCLFNQNYTLPSQSNQQHILSHGLQQWGSEIKCVSIENNKIRQHKECTSSAYPQEQPAGFENHEITKPLKSSLKKFYHSQELSHRISKNCAFIPYHTIAKTKTYLCPSINSRPDQTTYVTASSSAKTNSGSDFCGVNVIQHSMNNQAISVDSIKKNEERMSVISYPSQRGFGDYKSTKHLNGNAQFQSVPINAIVSQPKQELTLLRCDSSCRDIHANSTKHPIQVNRGVVKTTKTTNSSQLVKQSPKRATKPPKLKIESFGNSVNVISPSNAVPIDATLVQSDPIISDEKWEEWKSSFDTEWNAFVEDLAHSGNIKRIHRVSQPVTKKIKRREDVIPIPIKGLVDFKPSKIEDFASDEDIPLSLRRKEKEEKL